MRITVAGLWHLGCVTSACCARWFDVVGFDDDSELISNLNLGKAPLFEPGLDELIEHGVSNGRLRFTTNATDACAGADILWITYDTPVDDDDNADAAFVIERIRRCAVLLQGGAIVLISSQLPVGTCRQLEAEFKSLTFAYSPENLQLGKALRAFESPDRIIVGTRDGACNSTLDQVFAKFCNHVLWMRTESAEMVKHALNSFLAVSIAFINEIASVCEQTGADAKEVSSGLKSDVRIGPRAYLSAGAAFAGGTLARDIASLMQVAQEKHLRLDLIPAVKRSNDWHRGWAVRRLQERLSDLQGRRVGLLGLTYKPGTSTTRRSPALELARSLTSLGASVWAFDPVVKHLPDKDIPLAECSVNVAESADALVLCTEWPEFRAMDWLQALAAMRRPLVLDPNRFLEKELIQTKAEYLSVGRT